MEGLNGEGEPSKEYISPSQSQPVNVEIACNGKNCCLNKSSTDDVLLSKNNRNLKGSVEGDVNVSDDSLDTVLGSRQLICSPPDRREEPIFSNSVEKESRRQQWKKLTEEELIAISICHLHQILARLKKTIEDVSGELVHLLQERQSLQEQTDIRNVAIEQLLKVQKKFQLL